MRGFELGFHFFFFSFSFFPFPRSYIFFFVAENEAVSKTISSTVKEGPSIALRDVCYS